MNKRKETSEERIQALVVGMIPLITLFYPPSAVSRLQNADCGIPFAVSRLPFAHSK
jgi:hypothetical protein